ncbi:uncharacterized protein LOC117790542 [Drosophila innubila]|uniref:uncharacterized protein LOC117790542 n=1 Tax=Drosophila innubila TaxID=198719 RepID=UPI00148E3DE0|nr:uncharacterized protein LOC117790542 [Drosophila innubila]
MYLISAVARSRFKWLVICFLVMFIIVYISYQNDSINPNHKINDEKTVKQINLAPLHNFEIQGSFRSMLNESIINNIDVDDDVKEEDTEKPSLYYVENSKCKIPFIDPFAAEVMEDYKPEVFETCSNESDLVRPIFDMNRKRYVLHINETLAAEKLNSSDIEYNCYYQEITRKANHDSYNDLLPQIYFSQGYVVPFHVQGMILACHEAANTSNVLQKDGYALVQYKPLPASDPKKSTPRKPSVIMFGIDSMSRINFRRTMPKVFKFLTRRGWYEMQGYNKVGDNTFPNLMAILSGYLPDSAKEKVCDTDNKGCFDRMPFIWKFLKGAGYLTAYGEDECGINTFNYVKPGFVETPTDYYYRPFLKAFENEMDTWKCASCTLKYCIGRRVQSSYVYDYAKEFAKRYIDERPIWGLFWSSSFSHDSYSMPSKMENYILQYMLDFKQDGVFEQSIVVFFSDHGARFGTLTSYSSGFLEERLPMMFIYLPPWFRAKYPEYVKALELNRNRLTSNYDLHNTLKHIIEIGELPNSPKLPKASDCPTCQSLFYPVKEIRTCAEAGISEHYCTCQPYKRISTDWSKRIAYGVIDRMNDYLRGRNFSSLCENLTLSYVHKTEIKLPANIGYHDELPTIDVAYYRTKFKVRQNSADFFATVLYNNVTNNVDVDVETISRTNSYEEDSSCIVDKLAKLYCICQSLLKP